MKKTNKKKDKNIYKINYFIDNEDYIKKITNDEVINIIGSKGSGKTTTSLKYINDNNYLVINCDRLFDLKENNEETKDLIRVRDLLKEKYSVIKDDETFINCYLDIIEYAKKQNKKLLIEGNVIQGIDFNKIKGTIIIKRTARVKCFIRAVKRDYKNKYYLEKEKEKHKHIYKLTRLKNVIKRRIKIFKQINEIEEIIITIDNIK